MRISVAMATFNGENYLQAQLDSLQAQTRLPDELIVSDDHSSDGTVKVLEEFSQMTELSITIARNKERLGYSGNFNRALELTTGDLVFLCDQDDVWFPGKVETVERVAESERDYWLIMNNAALTDETLREVGLTKLEQIESAGLPRSSFVMGSCAAVRRELLALCLPIPIGYKGHDRWIVSFAVALGRRKIVDEVLQYYRRHDRNESSFIGNRIRRVKRIDVWTHYVGSLARGEDNEGQRIVNARMLRNGIQRAILECQDENISSLRQFETKISLELRAREKRAEIRCKSRLRRMGPVMWMLAKGCYRHCGGAKLAVRDVVFK